MSSVIAISCEMNPDWNYWSIEDWITLRTLLALSRGVTLRSWLTKV